MILDLNSILIQIGQLNNFVEVGMQLIELYDELNLIVWIHSG